MIPFVFKFPQDPMPGASGAPSGITHGKCHQLSMTRRGIDVSFYVGSLDPAIVGAVQTDLDLFRAHRVVETQTRLAPWEDIIALGGPFDPTTRNISVNVVLKVAWNVYRVEEGLPPDPII